MGHWIELEKRHMQLNRTQQQQQQYSQVKQTHHTCNQTPIDVYKEIPVAAGAFSCSS